MTKLSEAEQKVVTGWNVVIDALLSDLEHHQDQALAAYCDRDMVCAERHSKIMHRVAKTLTVFLDPSDD